MRVLTIFVAAIFAVVGHTASASTTIVFQDDFQADDTGGTTFFTTTTLTNWTVISGGNVDILPSGSGLSGSCANTCIDLDGTGSAAPARLETNSAFSFTSGTTYTLTLDFPGGTEADPFTFGILGGPTQSVFSFMAPFSPSLSFTALADFSAGLFIQMDTTVANNFGPYLDTVTLTARAPDPGIVPLPAGLWLLLSGLGAGFALHRRRRA